MNDLLQVIESLVSPRASSRDAEIIFPKAFSDDEFDLWELRYVLTYRILATRRLDGHPCVAVKVKP